MPLERNCWDGEGSESMPPPPPQNAVSSAAAFSPAPQYEYDILSSSKRTIFAMFLIFTLTKSGTLWQLGETPTRLMRKCPSSSPRGFYFRIMHVNYFISKNRGYALDMGIQILFGSVAIIICFLCFSSVHHVF